MSRLVRGFSGSSEFASLSSAFDGPKLTVYICYVCYVGFRVSEADSVFVLYVSGSITAISLVMFNEESRLGSLIYS